MSHTQEMVGLLWSALMLQMSKVGYILIENDGVSIRYQNPRGRVGDLIEVFVAYSDIRGVGRFIKSDGN